MWGVARAFGGRVLLRIEDHDRVRSRPEYEQAILADLEWLGFAADEPCVRQRDRETTYAHALDRLAASDLVYACDCSRKAVEAATGPTEGERRYPGTCRERRLDGQVERARRVRLDPATIIFRDLRLGVLQQHPAEEYGDVLVRDRLGHWTYQFAVVVDDIDQAVDLVIRGEDLLGSTGRQIQLARQLGRDRSPRFLHHPLITRPDGQKLSKANRDTGVRDLRAAGWTPMRVLGEAAVALGLTNGEPIDLPGVVARIQRLAPTR